LKNNAYKPFFRIDPASTPNANWDCFPITYVLEKPFIARESTRYGTVMKSLFVLVSLVCLVSATGVETPAANEALAKTLMSHKWIWAESVSGTKKLEELNFYKAGYAQNPEWFTARWECTGPRTFVLHNTNYGTHMAGKVAHLVFDEALVHFVGFDFDGKFFVEGFRREPVDPNREPPVTAVR
jgi:hypothetical protein